MLYARRSNETSQQKVENSMEMVYPQGGAGNVYVGET